MNIILFEDERERYTLAAGEERARHLTATLRAAPGDTFQAGVENGPLGTVRVVAVTAAAVELEARWERPGPATVPVTILLGHPRPPVLTRLWRDLTAIGVARIDVFIGELSERSYLQSGVWDDVTVWTRRGLSQGRRTVAPTIARHASLSAAIAAVPAAAGVGGEAPDVRFVASPGPHARYLREALELIARAGRAAIAIGPERGFSDAELSQLHAAGFVSLDLGPGTLRTETAAVAIAVAATATLAGR